MADRTKQLLSSTIRNPFSVFLLSLIVGIAVAYCARSWEKEIGEIWLEVANVVAASILTFGTFGVLFDFFAKRRLISEVVSDAVGQSRTLDLGIGDIRLRVSDVDYKEDILVSSCLAVGFRYSASFLDRHRPQIRERLVSGQKICIIRMTDATVFPTSRGFLITPEDFFVSLEKHDPGISKLVEVFETQNKLCYNFVKSDRGIWIKMYFNAPQPDIPPAFFVRRDSPLFTRFDHDIALLLAGGRKVFP